MSDKFKGIGCLILFGISCFNIGLYTVTEVNDLCWGGTDHGVEPYQWMFSGLLGLVMLGMGVQYLRKSYLP